MTTDSNTIQNLLTPAELARLLRMSKVNIYRLVDKRKIPFYRISGSLRFDEKDVKTYLRQNRIESVN